MIVHINLKPLQEAVSGLWGVASRRKRMSDEPSQLARVLNLVDLTMLGVGATLGLGVYVLTGKVAHGEAGPAVLLSFIIASVASLFAGLCYCEFAARVPKAGSAYVYAYVAVGEVVAFVIGWTLILEYAIGTSSIARGVSTYIDNLVDHRMERFFSDTMPFGVPSLAEYPDFFSFAVIVAMTALLAFGVKESSLFNNVLSFLNLAVVTIAVVTCAVYANPKNWSLAPRPGNPDDGEGGFVPYGVKGIIQGAATCFFGFVGFDGIATTSEEAKNPRRNIPLAIVISLVIVMVTYCSIAVVLTLAQPYYLLDREATFTVVFREMKLPVVMWVVTMGAVFALSASLVGVMFPLPRIMYAMAQDGLIFSVFARVNGRTKTPVIATVVAGSLAAVLALIFDLDQLTEMMSIGTLLAYTVVGLCVLVLRYTSVAALANTRRATRPSPRTSGAAGILVFAMSECARPAPPLPHDRRASLTRVSSAALLTLALCVLLKVAGNDVYTDPMPWLAPLLALLVPLIIVVVLLDQQPRTDVSQLSFTVPCLPYLPAVSLFLNLYLMMNLAVDTWIRFAVWMFIGGVLYVGYSLRHSTERLLEVAEKSMAETKADQATMVIIVAEHPVDTTYT
ncbi:hypothetical protein ONE63_001536 [Megalurothrips usitatus]|uniref:Cationic amino acid transporter C-terminal domain-containing protein n=1 Tax=Megalurothrips usitatus TaxID=439358 RepID=A0AAV7XG78_9NEOP|nr:hypothetical protein ONE63_001536 [Megalurothrips usitatus]